MPRQYPPRQSLYRPPQGYDSARQAPWSIPPAPSYNDYAAHPSSSNNPFYHRGKAPKMPAPPPTPSPEDTFESIPEETKNPDTQDITALLLKALRYQDGNAQTIAAEAEAERKARAKSSMRIEDKINKLEQTIMNLHANEVKRDKEREQWRKEDLAAQCAVQAMAEETKNLLLEKEKQLRDMVDEIASEMKNRIVAGENKEKTRHNEAIAALNDRMTTFEKTILEGIRAQKTLDNSGSLEHLKFFDAFGRKFIFPWQVCKTWKVVKPY